VFGEPDANGACRFLVQDGIHWNCGKYEEIAPLDQGRFPMFGSGCSSTLFNEDREAVIHAMAKAHREKGNGENVEGKGASDAG
jgi:hypothetical protein